MAHQRRLTFGVEFEFIVPQATHDSHPQDHRWFDRGEYSLNKEGSLCPILVDCLKSVVPIVEDKEYGTALDAANKHGITLQPGCALPFSYFWTTDVDGSVAPRPMEDVKGNYGYLQHPMEISSRILQEDEFHEVALVYRQLRATMRINLNSSCSFHVHVGSDHLDLLAFQKLATLIMICEPFLFRCCETHRRNSIWCLGIASHSKTAQVRRQTPPSHAMQSLMPPKLSRHFLESLGGIWAATSIDELRDQLKVQFGGGFGEYAIRGAFAIRGNEWLTDANGELCASPTVEFRYSHASGDPKRDSCFVRICVALVKAAESNPATYRDTVASFARGGDFSNFLGPLGLQDMRDFWTAAETEYIQRGAYPPTPATAFLSEI